MKENCDINIGWNFDNTYARLPKIFFTAMKLRPVNKPVLVAFNQTLAETLGLNSEKIKSEHGASILAGNKVPNSASPLAQAYAGHQFGHFTMLGDGRAILLGEHISPAGKRFDIQLKGSGITPYSRGGDGRAALGPMLREYIISEAMQGLGIPTTRSLSVVITNEKVIRETDLMGAVLTRVASSHIRVGTFEYVSQWGTEHDLRILADYTLRRHFPYVGEDKGKYLLLLREAVSKQASLIAKWQLVGFIHGVMNTDNMAISGETIDYGPCAFMDTYAKDTVFSSIDIQGRYSYENQPYIAGWNLARFAETLFPLLHINQNKAIEIAQEEINRFSEIYQEKWLAGMRAKLGLHAEEKDDETFIIDFLNLMEKYKADYTNTFRALTLDDYSKIELFDTMEFKEWHRLWQNKLKNQQREKETIKSLMKSNNASVIPRNHRVEEAIGAAVKYGDYNVMEKLLGILKSPYSYLSEQEEYTTLPEPSIHPYKTFCGT